MISPLSWAKSATRSFDIGEIDPDAQHVAECGARRVQHLFHVAEYLPSLFRGIRPAHEAGLFVEGSHSGNEQQVSELHGIGVVADRFVQPFDRELLPSTL
jgi:hypothetical protein